MRGYSCGNNPLGPGYKLPCPHFSFAQIHVCTCLPHSNVHTHAHYCTHNELTPCLYCYCLGDLVGFLCPSSNGERFRQSPKYKLTLLCDLALRLPDSLTPKPSENLTSKPGLISPQGFESILEVVKNRSSL